jgi:hypothetical protein
MRELDFVIGVTATRAIDALLAPSHQTAERRPAAAVTRRSVDAIDLKACHSTLWSLPFWR